jgi:DNA (cytosine-5)-methyltransferase 1
MSHNAVSLFSGAGGLDLGFETAGFRVKVMVEKERWACETLRFNFPDAVVLGPPDSEGDVRNVTGEGILRAAGLKPNEVDIVLAGPPCQPFSIAAAQRFLKGDAKFKRLGVKDKVRGTLTVELLRLVADIKPKLVLMENVPGLVTLDHGSTLTNIKKSLSELGYKPEHFLVNAADYGVPQKRERVFIIAGKGLARNPTFPAATHSPAKYVGGNPAYRTVSHALYGLYLPGRANHIRREHRPQSLARYRKLEVGEREPLGRVDRLDPSKPSKTVIAGGTRGGGRSHLHPYLARTLTVRESARLQSFPDNFQFFGSTGRQFTQVGNAVPPLLAEAIARHIRRDIMKEDIDSSLALASLYPDSLSASEIAASVFQAARKEAPELLYDDLALPQPQYA